MGAARGRFGEAMRMTKLPASFKEVDAVKFIREKIADFPEVESLGLSSRIEISA